MPTAMPALAPVEIPPDEAGDGLGVWVGLRLVGCDTEFVVGDVDVVENTLDVVVV
jgi:hypothetical protein